MIAIGIDIGGTKVAAGRVTPEGVLEARTEVPMPKGSADAREAMLALVRELHTADVVAIGMGAPGLITPEGRFTWGPNVSIADLPLRDMIEEEFRVPAVVDNDVNVAAVAEHRVGAARGTKNALMITVGTGIGGGLIVDGRLYRGVSFAGEVGHMVIERDGALCTCGRRGCWEAMASGRVVTEWAGKIVEAEPTGPLAVLCQGEDPTGPLLTRAALDGDLASKKALAEVGYWLGVGIANLTCLLDPEVVVVGGGAGAAGDLMLEPAREVLRVSYGAEHRGRPAIVPAVLQNDAGAIGAGLLALDRAAASA